MADHLTFELGGTLPIWDGAATDPVVLVHEPGARLAPARAEALVAALDDAAAVVAVLVRPVTDTLKVVTDGQVVVGTADREHHRFVGAPFAVRLGLLRSVGPPATAESALRALARAARLVPVEDPGASA